MSYRIVLAQRNNHHRHEDESTTTTTDTATGRSSDNNKAPNSNFHNIAAADEEPAAITTTTTTPSSLGISTTTVAKLSRQERTGRDKITLLESMAGDVFTQQFHDALNTIIHSCLINNNNTDFTSADNNNNTNNVTHRVSTSEHLVGDDSFVDEDSAAMASSFVSGSAVGSARFGGGGTSVRSGGVTTSYSWGKGGGGTSSVSRGTSRSTKSKKDERKRRLDKLRADEDSKKNSWRVEAQVLLFTSEQDTRDQVEETQLLDFVEITKYYFVDVEGNYFNDVQKRLYQSKDTVLPRNLTHTERAMLMMTSNSFSSQRSLTSVRSYATSTSRKPPPHGLSQKNHSTSSSVFKKDGTAVVVVSCVNVPIDDDPVLLRKRQQHIPILQGLVKELLTTTTTINSSPTSPQIQIQSGQYGEFDENRPLSYRPGTEEHKGAAQVRRRDSLHSIASTEYEMDGNSEWEAVGGGNPRTCTHITTSTTATTTNTGLIPFLGVGDAHPPQPINSCTTTTPTSEAGGHSTSNAQMLDVSVGAYPVARATTAAGPGSVETTDLPGRLGKPPQHNASTFGASDFGVIGNPTTLSSDQQPVVCYNGVPMRLRQRRLGPIVYQYQEQPTTDNMEVVDVPDEEFEEVEGHPHIAEEAVNEEVEEPTHNNIDEEAEEREHVPDEEVEELVPPQVRDEEMEEASVQHDGNALLLFSDADRDVSLLQRFHYPKSTRAAMLFCLFEAEWRSMWKDQVLEFTALVSATSPFLSVQSRIVSVIKTSRVFIGEVRKYKDELAVLERVEWRRLINHFWRSRRNLLSQQKAELIVKARDVITNLLRQERRERSRLLVCEVPCHPLFLEFKPSETPQELVPLRYAWSQWVSTFEATSSARKVVLKLKSLERHCSQQLSQRYLIKLMYFTRNQVLVKKLEQIRSDAEQPLLNQCFEVMKAPAAVKVAGRRLRMHVYRSRAVCLHTLLGGYFSKWLDIYRQGHPTPPAATTAQSEATTKDVASDDGEVDDATAVVEPDVITTSTTPTLDEQHTTAAADDASIPPDEQHNATPAPSDEHLLPAEHDGADDEEEL